MRVPMLAALLVLSATSVAAQDCRANFGGSYTYAHVGVKPDGHFFSAIAGFAFHPQGTFDVNAGINERGAAPFPVGVAGHAWWWIDDCELPSTERGLSVASLTMGGSSAWRPLMTSKWLAWRSATGGEGVNHIGQRSGSAMTEESRKRAAQIGDLFSNFRSATVRN